MIIKATCKMMAGPQPITSEEKLHFAGNMDRDDIKDVMGTLVVRCMDEARKKGISPVNVSQSLFMVHVRIEMSWDDEPKQRTA